MTLAVQPTATVLGYTLHLGSAEALLEAAWQTAQAGTSVQVVTLNPEMMMAGDANPAFGKILKTAELALADGAGAVWALRKQGVRQERVPGIEFAYRLLQRCESEAEGVALFGAAPTIAATAVTRLKEALPELDVVYEHHGFVADADSMDACVEALVAAEPKLVLLALGVPRQELWIAEHRSRFAAGTVFVGVGGSFDVWSGTLKRAPKLMQALHLEWAWRFALQPWRLQRSLKPLLTFVWRVLRSSPAA